MDPLPPNLIAELRSASPQIEMVVELELDSGTVTVSRTAWHGIPILNNVGRLQHKLQPPYGKTSIANLDVDLIDRSEWGSIVADNYIKNRRANILIRPTDPDSGPWTGRQDIRFGEETEILWGTEDILWGEAGGSGGGTDYYRFFTGLIVDYEIEDEILTLDIRDDLYIAKGKIPEENETNTQTLVLQNLNPIDIKKTLLETYAGVPSERIDDAAFTAEKNQWFLQWAFERVITKPIEIKKLINELDEQTLNYVFGDGDKITTATFAPPVPGTTQKQLSDITPPGWIAGSLSAKGQMEDNFYNLCVVYYDYDESGGDKEENFDSVAIVSDSASQGSDQWDEVARKEIKSKWIRSYTIAQPSNITGVVVYHCCPQNGAGTGTLSYNYSNQTLTWTAPGDSAGAAVDINDGKFQLFSANTTKYIRVMVMSANLPGSNKSDDLAITSLPGTQIAALLASHYVMRYANPQAEISFSLDLRDAIHNDRLLRVSDIVRITSKSIVSKGKNGWDDERIFLTSMRPDIGGNHKRMQMGGMLTSFKRRYGFIGPASLTSDYDAASEDDREYAFVGDDNNQVGSVNEDGYYIW